MSEAKTTEPRTVASTCGSVVVGESLTPRSIHPTPYVYGRTLHAIQPIIQFSQLTVQPLGYTTNQPVIQFGQHTVPTIRTRNDIYLMFTN